MTTRLKKMWELAIDEAKKLRKYASQEQKKRLIIDIYFHPNSNYNCIYGKMTGDCYSKEAGDLIIRCAKKVYANSRDPSPFYKAKLNGSPTPVNGIRGYKYHSPIEMLISNVEDYMPVAEQLAAFIKGETKKIVIPK